MVNQSHSEYNVESAELSEVWFIHLCHNAVPNCIHLSMSHVQVVVVRKMEYFEKKLTKEVCKRDICTLCFMFICSSLLQSIGLFKLRCLTFIDRLCRLCEAEYQVVDN